MAPQPNPTPQAPMIIRVINHNKRLFKGRYDAVDYVFRTDVPVDLPLEAAVHIFGLGNEDKTQALNMLGVLVPGRDTVEDALKWLDNFSFQQGKTVFEDELAPRRVARSKPVATGSRKSGPSSQLAGPGGNEGEEAAPSSPAEPPAQDDAAEDDDEGVGEAEA